MYQARKVKVPSQESECTSWLGTFTFLAWYIHFPGLVHSLSLVDTFTFLAWYIHFPGLVHSLFWLGTFTFLARYIHLIVPSQESECTKQGK
jgi:uncharacterized membrane protein (DUF485 family)